MAKRSQLKNDGTGIKAAVETSPEEVILIPIIAVYPSILKHTSQTTGKSYTWNGAGDVQQVDPKDVPVLLAKRIGGRGCCGATNTNGNKVFELKEAA